jgi:hypothetical protein
LITVEPGLLLGDIRIVIRRGVAVMLAAGGVVALAWDSFALLVALLVGQNWNARAVLTVLVMAVGDLAGIGLVWAIWPHRARLHWPTRWLHHEDSSDLSSSSPVPPLPTSRRPKFSE